MRLGLAWIVVAACASAETAHRTPSPVPIAPSAVAVRSDQSIEAIDPAGAPHGRLTARGTRVIALFATTDPRRAVAILRRTGTTGPHYEARRIDVDREPRWGPITVLPRFVDELLIEDARSLAVSSSGRRAQRRSPTSRPLG